MEFVHWTENGEEKEGEHLMLYDLDKKADIKVPLRQEDINL